MVWPQEGGAAQGPRLPAVAKGLLVFPRCEGRCPVSLQLAASAAASSHSSDLDLLPLTGLEAQPWSSPFPSPDPLAPLANPGPALPRSRLPECQSCRGLG